MPVNGFQLPPGPRTPATGQFLEWVMRPWAVLDRCFARYGDVFTLRLARVGTFVVVSDPALIESVFRGDPRVFHAGEGNRVLRPLLGPRSLLLLDEDEHLRERKLLLPPFHGRALAALESLIRDVCERHLAHWPVGQRVRIRPLAQALTLEVIARAVFGLSGRQAVDDACVLLRRALAWAAERRRLFTFALLGPQRVERSGILRGALAPVEALIREEVRRARADTRLEQREDVLAMLVRARREDGSALSDEELRDELVTLLVAGHETTATALAWGLERLARHPEVVERLRREVASGGHAYRDATVQEILRLRPVIPLVVRLLKQPVALGPWSLPAGVVVAPAIYLVHKRPDVYPEPMRFRPERFLERPPGTYTWLPFGGGVRRCIGASLAQLELALALAGIVQRFDITPGRPGDEARVRRAVTWAPAADGEVVLAARSSPASTAAPSVAATG
ncbi:Cytochrome P450 [Thermoleophilum album]|uniref:Cytochrome P450 n=1 Tax=Thermoleophilum album TaxID=29539 RepID=A0A1H6FXE9_THEAL|nr:Cytochrome P450 [Thermoleophilum album]